MKAPYQRYQGKIYHILIFRKKSRVERSIYHYLQKKNNKKNLYSNGRNKS